MATPYQARHRRSSPERGGARDPALQSRPAISRALRRPLASAAAVVAVAGASAGGYAAGPMPRISAEPFTTSLPTAAPAQQKVADRAQAAARVRAQAAARVRARSALDRARRAAGQRAAREQERQSILARSRSNPRAVARLLAADRGWGEKQFTCLDNLWTRESGWRWDADNPTSDAYGIPQSLPGAKMASVGSDWRTNPLTQIRWGLKYISNRYGTPCSGWSFWLSKYPHWY